MCKITDKSDKFLLNYYLGALFFLATVYHVFRDHTAVKTFSKILNIKCTDFSHDTVHYITCRPTLLLCYTHVSITSYLGSIFRSGA